MGVRVAWCFCSDDRTCLVVRCHCCYICTLRYCKTTLVQVQPADILSA